MALTQVKTLGIAADAVTGAKVADDQIDSEHYIAASIDNEHLANNAVDTDEIADDAVTLAKMDALARGRLIVGDASGNPSALAAGSDNYVLTMDANGDAGWEAAAAGGATINNATADEIVTVASTTTQLDAEANLTFDGSTTFTQTSSSDLHMKLISGTSGYSRICLGDSGDDDIGEILYNNANNQLGIKTNAAERLLINNAGDVTVSTGNVVIGTAGKGIDFSATAHYSTSGDGEVLTTYEEGTWTPSPMFGGGNTGQAKSVAGTYVRVGKSVTAYYQIIFTDKGSSTGTFQIGGFPFSNSQTEYTLPSFGYFHRLIFAADSTYMITCNLSGTTSTWRYAVPGTSASGINMGTVTEANVSSGMHIAGALNYRCS